ncbi:hypothetical protein [Sphingomonas sp. Leaf230]|uniref:hypothetical protein n=1 Tax=Sphingomonas sp. Leaf230 TaxID=1735694 RepID=UPI000A860B6C|nr:hypothetical protein [Sphingomonas sp. Leaf230]
MPYMQTGSFVIKTIRVISISAIVLQVGARKNSYLVTGASPSMVVRLDGDTEGSAFELANAGNVSGLSFEEILFEVDLDSSFQPAMVEQPLGALVMHDGGMYIIATTRSQHGFEDAALFPIGKATARPSGAAEVGFTKWRAVKVLGSERVEILKFEATKKADF